MVKKIDNDFRLEPDLDNSKIPDNIARSACDRRIGTVAEELPIGDRRKRFNRYLNNNSYALH